MNNSINILLNSLSDLGKIRKADNNIAEYSSESDNTMAVGTRMYDRRLFVTQEMIDDLQENLIIQVNNLYNIMFLGDNQYYESFIDSKHDYHNYLQCFIELDEDLKPFTLFDLTYEKDIKMFLKNRQNEDFYAYCLRLTIPIKEIKFADYYDSVELMAIFSPFQYSIYDDIKKITLIKTPQNIKKGSLTTLIKNGNFKVFKIYRPLSQLINKESPSDLIDFKFHCCHSLRWPKVKEISLPFNVNEAKKSELIYGKDYILENMGMMSMDLSNINFPLNYLFDFKYQQIYDIDKAHPYNTDIDWSDYTKDENSWFFDGLLKNKEYILDK